MAKPLNRRAAPSPQGAMPAPRRRPRTTAQTAPEGKPEQHPDAQIFALAERALTILADKKAAEERLEVAEQRLEDVEIPVALRRTEQDREFGFFVGNAVGAPYEYGDIALLRQESFRLGHSSGDEMHDKAWRRSQEILKAWNQWRSLHRIEDGRADAAVELAAYTAASEIYDATLSLLGRMVPATVEGMLAKVRAFEYYTVPHDAMGDYIDKEERSLGVGEHFVRLVTIRDALALALRPPSEEARAAQSRDAVVLSSAGGDRSAHHV